MTFRLLIDKLCKIEVFLEIEDALVGYLDLLFRANLLNCISEFYFFFLMFIFFFFNFFTLGDFILVGFYKMSVDCDGYYEKKQNYY